MSATLTKKIIILGHGFIQNSSPNPSSVSANVYFYCPANRYLDRHFIPTFIQYILGQINLDCVKSVITNSLIDGKLDYIQTFEEDKTFPFEDYNNEHIVSSEGDFMFQMLCSRNLPDNAINYTSSSEKKNLNELFESAPQNIEIENGTFIRYELQGDTIVIVPNRTCLKKTSLSVIIGWATKEYQGVRLEFHWLACREPFTN